MSIETINESSILEESETKMAPRKNNKKTPRIGSKIQVWRGTALQTSGGLKKGDLIKNKRGKIVSRKKHEQGKLRFKENKLKPRTADELAELRKLKKK